ncbi:hypothetical protein [Larkinella terrae]|uniref:Uncharacterized protein n=1 Tax=Larkinella terrae TaxID=2025311 RepID=A0A7K0ERH3_9BACT|nr:hypothetical protein [Larkinella terrae]MRS64018.1 hypothetical protein [Larkinella terrae]
MSVTPKPNRYYVVQKEPVLLTAVLLKELPPDIPQPIKLTKPWLLAFGFQPDRSTNFWSLENARLVAGMNCWLCTKSRRYIQYVHELQDLFEEHFRETTLVLKSLNFYVSGAV